MKSCLLRALFTCFTLLALSLPAVSSADVITFESDAPGSVANGFTSNDASVVHFSDSIGSDLLVADYGSQSDGLGLGVFGDDASGLIIEFDGFLDMLSLDFGGDLNCCSTAGDIALLTVFQGDTQVDQISVVLNRNGSMDQTITFFGSFDRATFFYTDASFNPINLAEIVDNVEFNVPIPPALWLFGSGLLGLLGMARRKKV